MSNPKSFCRVGSGSVFSRGSDPDSVDLDPDPHSQFMSLLLQYYSSIIFVRVAGRDLLRICSRRTFLFSLT